MNKNDFKKISIRGRVAFAICCLESIIMAYRYDINEWSVLLNRLWLIAELEDVSDWLYITAECLPENILEAASYDYGSFQHINEDEYEQLYKLYSECKEDTWELIEIIFDLGTAQMYSNIKGFSEATLNEIEKVITFMKAKNISMPSVSQFRMLLYYDGWGETFDRKELSLVQYH